MQDVQKKIIRFVLDYDISNINTYAGYKGDLIIKVTTKNREDVIDLRKYALSLGVKEVVIKEKLDTKQYEIFCVTVDDDVYTLR
ncbi:MAG: hypothetical protein PHW18_08995 [Sulfuricurvum sp.]|uniref:hypothetical protein n=1 Tax=Sulfuricurvum sp. TaxID=2025608 RepID=UPI00260D4977|nr:hypothetical protein [Sulfuricurvum sp.]MDD2829695.1 hypothetical protein [Sulfuricurvum sp.]MDD4950137.1 hypothetical protein [Sulfuricurvum sp.]